MMSECKCRCISRLAAVDSAAKAHISAEAVIRLGDVYLCLLQLTCTKGSFWLGAERTTAAAACGYRVRLAVLAGMLRMI